MARIRRRLAAPPVAGPAPAPPASDEFLPVLARAQGISRRIGQLKADFAGAHRLAHQAQVSEALSRVELSLALNESLAARAELAARLRTRAVADYAAKAQPMPLRRYGRANRTLDRMLMRLGRLGQALVVARSGLWPGVRRPLFDPAFYLAANPDVAARRMRPFAHYLVHGGRAGRNPHPLLDEAFYRDRHGEALAASGLTSLEHYERVGAAAGFSPHPLFDPAHYLAQLDGLAPGDCPVSHYLREGWQARLSPHPLFDAAWYLKQAGKVDGPPLIHYLTVGWRKGWSPHPLFDPAWYRDQDHALAEADIEPLTHFLTFGAREGRDPSPWFDTAHYVAARGEARDLSVSPLVDYLQGGAWAVGEPRPGFPTAAYLGAHPSLARRGVAPLEHWARRRGI